MIKFLREKVLVFLIQYTIGLLFPWWLIDFINARLIEGYSGKFTEYGKLIKYTLGLVLPWWILILLQGNKMETMTDGTKSTSKTKEVYFCKYCGVEYNSVDRMTGSICPRHEDGQGKGRCTPYEGGVKDKYVCKFCGTSAKSINILTGGVCVKHPMGQGKGRHQPMI